jgi:hypothetical protein
MPLCVNVEHCELQERDERVPVVHECVREREARSRRQREGDKERCGRGAEVDLSDAARYGGGTSLLC